MELTTQNSIVDWKLQNEERYKELVGNFFFFYKIKWKKKEENEEKFSTPIIIEAKFYWVKK